MSYDERLAERIRKTLAKRRGVVEKEMFGGVAFLLGGRMFCGIVKDDLMVRVGPERHDEALEKPHVRPMDFAGRPMKGYVYVAPAGCKADAALANWVRWGAEVVAAMGPKKPPPRKPARAKAARPRH
jgi:TfoX/Sxy family transcriptional regulator of competence genes